MLILWTSVVWAVPPLLFPSGSFCEGRTIDIAMVGDVMQHGEQLKASSIPDGSHSWNGVFTAITPLIRDADLAFANLETPVDPSQAYAGYPFFNAPTAVLDALSDAGFDSLQTANNHCLDRGRTGAINTLKTLHNHGFQTAGTWSSREEHDTPWALHTLPDGIRVAFLANTYGTNGQPMPTGEPWLVNWLDVGQMEHDILRASAHADIVVVGLHWGGEYKHHPVSWQRQMAKSLIAAGADVVMGSHPHVLQPAEVITVEDRYGPREGLILYSLGNFVSNQRTFPRHGGVIARASFTRCGQDVRLSDVHFTPVWVDDRIEGAPRKAFRVVPVAPPNAPCGGYDLDAYDCTRMLAFREHAASLLPAAQFSWTAGDHGNLARRPVPPWPNGTKEGALDPVVLPTKVWPPPALAPTQQDR